MATKKTAAKPWEEPMDEKTFTLMRDILAAPSPIGLEAAMTYGVLKPHLEKVKKPDWKIHQYKGNAGIVLDTDPKDDSKCSVMLIGHADKIRLQVRSIGEDGKVWINSDSFLPMTLIGHEVQLFSENPKKPGEYRVLEGGTVEALGAIHFAKPAVRSGESGIKPEMLYLELQLYGKDRRKQIEKMGIRPGDSILLKRPIKRGVGKNTFYGAYLDNGLGCFVAAEVARILAKGPVLKKIRVQFAMATHEEIGRFGSRVLAGELKPDVLIGIDVNHDYSAAPGVGDQRFTPLAMSEGMTHATGAITSEYLNTLLQKACKAKGIPLQRDAVGRDTGTDAMAAVLASVDSAATSVGFPTRNMHTISEIGHTGDVLACVHGLVALIRDMDKAGVKADDFRRNHPRLDKVKPIKI